VFLDHKKRMQDIARPRVAARELTMVTHPPLEIFHI